jgi:hypothetical protein
MIYKNTKMILFCCGFLMLLTNSKASQSASQASKPDTKTTQSASSKPVSTTDENQFLKTEYLWRQRLQTLTVVKALNMATEMRLYRRSGGFGSWPVKPLAILSEKSFPEMFHLLKQTVSHSPGVAEPLDSYKVALIIDGKLLGELTYFPEAGGHIGDGKEWGTVPEKFVDWTNMLAENEVAPQKPKMP